MTTGAATRRVGHKLDGNLMISQQFAKCLCAFRECSDEVQALVLEMAQIVNDPEAADDDRDAAAATIAEAIFPCSVNGMPGIDLEDAESKDGDRALRGAMDQEEGAFADRLGALMTRAGMTQKDLAAATGVGQPAISMMLARKCRPQRRTVEKLAAALKVGPEEIWPAYKGE